MLRLCVLYARATHVAEHDAHKCVEWDAEDVDDCRAQLLRHVVGPHRHHAWPEDAHAQLKRAEGQQLDLALERDGLALQA